MRVTSKAARELVERARGFRHALLPREGRQVIVLSVAVLADLVDRVEKLEAENGESKG